MHVIGRIRSKPDRGPGNIHRFAYSFVRHQVTIQLALTTTGYNACSEAMKGGAFPSNSKRNASVAVTPCLRHVDK